MSIRKKKIGNFIIELNLDEILIKDINDSIIRVEQIPSILTERSIVYFEEFIEKFKYIKDKYKNIDKENIKTNTKNLYIVGGKKGSKITYLKYKKEYQITIANPLKAKRLLDRLKKDKKIKILKVEDIL